MDNNFALRVASENGHIEVVRVLTSDPRVDLRTVLIPNGCGSLLRTSLIADFSYTLSN